MATETPPTLMQSGRSAAMSAMGQSDFWMAMFALGILGMLIVPLPGPVLDLVLTLNLALSVAVLLVTAYVRDPLEFSVFPSLLLFSALFRTALSVAVMRSILLHADGGSVVGSFGRFVLGDNYLVGFVVFLTLLVVQFVVVTGGASRIAEVSARFTLDSMPGKQMSIDADLNAGLINQDQSRQRRRHIQSEADFYGAMDGASKFVRGDAVASALVTAINILGGVVIGLLNQGFDIMEALRTYALLTVGQGLIIQIPALLISAASALIVTRAASDQNLSAEFASQMRAQPRALYAAALGCFCVGVLPGLPKLPFLVLAVGLSSLARVLERSPAQLVEPVLPTTEPDEFLPQLAVDPLEVGLGFALVSLAVEREGGMLLSRITQMRKKLTAEIGIFIPMIRVRDNLELKANCYSIKLRGVQVAHGELLPGNYLAIPQSPLTAPLEGAIDTRDPTFGLPAYWIGPDGKAAAQAVGCTVVDMETALITHLSDTIRLHAHELLTRQDLQALLDMVRQNSPAVLEELVPNLLTRGEVQRVLQNLLAEQVSLKDLVAVLEALAEGARTSKDTDHLTGLARQRLARTICRQWQSEDALATIAVDPALERRLAEFNAITDQGMLLAPDAETLQCLLEGVSRHVETATAQGRQPIIACSSRLRLSMRRLLARFLPRVPVLSYEEAALGGAQLNTIGVVA